ncbi:MAG: hypothetical protein LBO82_02720 [Synergistaceae bacterium]|jgi:hypothetical protein|nr:hypothetical protein [Synergistaceae bacterium]
MSLNIAKVIFRKLKTAWKLTSIGVRAVYTGQYTLWEFMLSYVNYTIATFTHKDLLLPFKAKVKRMKKYLRDGVYVFKEVRLPMLNSGIAADIMLAYVVDDTFLVYLKHNDCYDEAKINALYEYLPDGPYCLRNEQVDVTLDNAGGGVSSWTREAG